MNLTIARLLDYSFSGVEWDFNRLTTAEQGIVGTQAALDEIKSMVLYEYEYCEFTPEPSVEAVPINNDASIWG